MTINICLAQTKDVPALIEIENALFNSDKLSKAQFYYHLRSLKNKLFVAHEHHEITGYILLFIHRHSARIYSLAVSPNHQGKGIARELMMHTINHLNTNIRNVFLEVNTNNLKAIHLYQKLGFGVSKTIHNYYDNGDSAYRMKKAFTRT
ncbi:MAG: ribosomal protein S18-alanine N-acetyltransferase [Proteobacteria bacterium]|nr:ribosomal protein S18-alanine N-acetyltransferase [Pseudomonadota bacterium]